MRPYLIPGTVVPGPGTMISLCPPHPAPSTSVHLTPRHAKELRHTSTALKNMPKHNQSSKKRQRGPTPPPGPPPNRQPSSFLSRRNKLSGPPQKRKKLSVGFVEKTTKKSGHVKLQRTISTSTTSFYRFNQFFTVEGAIFIKTLDGADFRNQLRSGTFKFTRMIDVSKELQKEVDRPIFLYNPEDCEIAGPYCMPPPYNKNTVVTKLDGHIPHQELYHICRYLPPQQPDSFFQNYDSRPRIVSCSSSHVDALEGTIFGRHSSACLNKDTATQQQLQIVHVIKRLLSTTSSSSLGTLHMYKDNSDGVYEDPLYVEYFRYFQVQSKTLSSSLFNLFGEVCDRERVPWNLGEISKAFNQWVFAVGTPPNLDDPVIPCYEPIEPPFYLRSLVETMIKTVSSFVVLLRDAVSVVLPVCFVSFLVLSFLFFFLVC